MKKTLSIVILPIDALTRIPTAADMMDGSRKLKAQRSRQGVGLPHQMC